MAEYEINPLLYSVPFEGYTSNNEYNASHRIWLTNEVPMVDTFEALHHMLQNDFWQWLTGWTATTFDVPFNLETNGEESFIEHSNQLQDVSIAKYINGIRIKDYGPQPTWNQISYDEEGNPLYEIPEYTRTEINGTLLPDLDLLLHECYRYLQYQVPNHPDFVQILTDNEIDDQIEDIADLIDYKINTNILNYLGRQVVHYTELHQKPLDPVEYGELLTDSQSLLDQDHESIKVKMRNLFNNVFRRKLYGSKNGYWEFGADANLMVQAYEVAQYLPYKPFYLDFTGGEGVYIPDTFVNEQPVKRLYYGGTTSKLFPVSQKKDVVTPLNLRIVINDNLPESYSVEMFTTSEEHPEWLNTKVFIEENPEYLPYVKNLLTKAETWIKQKDLYYRRYNTFDGFTTPYPETVFTVANVSPDLIVPFQRQVEWESAMEIQPKEYQDRYVNSWHHLYQHKFRLLDWTGESYDYSIPDPVKVETTAYFYPLTKFVGFEYLYNPPSITTIQDNPETVEVDWVTTPLDLDQHISSTMDIDFQTGQYVYFNKGSQEDQRVILSGHFLEDAYQIYLDAVTGTETVNIPGRVSRIELGSPVQPQWSILKRFENPLIIIHRNPTKDDWPGLPELFPEQPISTFQQWFNEFYDEYIPQEKPFGIFPYQEGALSMPFEYLLMMYNNGFFTNFTHSSETITMNDGTEKEYEIHSTYTILSDSIDSEAPVQRGDFVSIKTNWNSDSESNYDTNEPYIAGNNNFISSISGLTKATMTLGTFYSNPGIDPEKINELILIPNSKQNAEYGIVIEFEDPTNLIRKTVLLGRPRFTYKWRDTSLRDYVIDNVVFNVTAIPKTKDIWMLRALYPDFESTVLKKYLALDKIFGPLNLQEPDYNKLLGFASDYYNSKLPVLLSTLGLPDLSIYKDESGYSIIPPLAPLPGTTPLAIIKSKYEQLLAQYTTYKTLLDNLINYAQNVIIETHYFTDIIQNPDSGKSDMLKVMKYFSETMSNLPEPSYLEKLWIAFDVYNVHDVKHLDPMGTGSINDPSINNDPAYFDKAIVFISSSVSNLISNINSLISLANKLVVHNTEIDTIVNLLITKTNEFADYFLHNWLEDHVYNRSDYILQEDKIFVDAMKNVWANILTLQQKEETLKQLTDERIYLHFQDLQTLETVTLLYVELHDSPISDHDYILDHYSERKKAVNEYYYDSFYVSFDYLDQDVFAANYEKTIFISRCAILKDLITAAFNQTVFEYTAHFSLNTNRSYYRPTDQASLLQFVNELKVISAAEKDYMYTNNYIAAYYEAYLNEWNSPHDFNMPLETIKQLSIQAGIAAGKKAASQGIINRSSLYNTVLEYDTTINAESANR